MIRISSILVGLLAILALAVPARASDWHRADTYHFVIYSDGSARTLEDFARRAEMFDALFRQHFGLQVKPDPQRLTIYLLSDREEVGKLAGDENGTLAGFYRATAEGSFAVAHRERSRRETDLSGQTVLFHEYVHHLMANNFTYAYPAWYREGFAEYFATAEIENDGDWTLGAPANHRAYGLRQVRMPLEQVVFANTANLDRGSVDAYYGRSWALVHMFANDPALTQRLNEYLAQLGSGAEPESAFAQVFGDIETIEDQLEDYVRGRLTQLESVAPISFVGDVRITRLDDAASDLVPLELARRVGNELQQTRDALAALSATHPGNSAVLTELSLAEYALANEEDERDFSSALAATDRALALDPDNVRGNVLRAELLAATNQGDVAEIRRYLQRAIAADPNYPPAHITLYDSYMQEGRRPSVDVVNGLLGAYMRAPEDHNLRVAAAYALANEGMMDRAIGLVEFLAADPHAGAFGQRVLEDLRRMQR